MSDCRYIQVRTLLWEEGSSKGIEGHRECLADLAQLASGVILVPGAMEKRHEGQVGFQVKSR